MHQDRKENKLMLWMAAAAAAEEAENEDDDVDDDDVESNQQHRVSRRLDFCSNDQIWRIIKT